MDYRSIPGATGHRPWLCGRCRRPLREARGWKCDVVSVATLYALAATIIGAPLAFPGWVSWWLVVNLALALLAGCVVAARLRAATTDRCPACGQARTPGRWAEGDFDDASLVG